MLLHLPGSLNTIADTESRSKTSNLEWMINPSILQEALRQLSFIPEVDLFASQINKQSAAYVSYRPDPNALAVDAFTIQWTDIKLYAFPPFSVIPLVLNKIYRDQAQGIIVIPKWTTQYWYPKALQLLKEAPIKLKASTNLLQLPQNPQAVHPVTCKSKITGMSLIRERLDQHNFSTATKEILLCSWRSGSRKQYNTYLNKWEWYCEERTLSKLNPGLDQAIEFLTFLFESGLGYSALNTARSALSTILPLFNGIKFGENPLVCWFLKGVYEQRPALPRYKAIWNVGKVLNYLTTMEQCYRINFEGSYFKVDHAAMLTYSSAMSNCTIIRYQIYTGIRRKIPNNSTAETKTV